MASVLEGVEQVDPHEASELLDAGAFLLDVREHDEWDAGHAPEATHLPMGQIADNHSGLLSRDNRIVAVCRSGARSHRVAQFLKNAGYDAANLAGGMKAWASSGKPVVTETGDPGNVI